MKTMFQWLSRKGPWFSLVAFFSASLTNAVMAAEPAQDPLFLTQPVRPLVMLNMSNDHQLFFKLYDDYGNLDGSDDGSIDTTYMNDYQYFGYFDSDMCYEYQSGVFAPTSLEDASGYCNSGATSNQWSGNFLNWATMTRMDAIRKILYGGKRSTDTADKTVLERAFLPHDAHSFAKYYNGTDIDLLTPFSVTEGQDIQGSGITICNTTEGSGYSQDVTNPPLLRVAQGNFSLWAGNERWQCRWNEDVTEGNDGQNENDPLATGIKADPLSPNKSGEFQDALGIGDYTVRVEVCSGVTVDSRDVRQENCSAYGDTGSASYKPTGLLQDYGEDGSILFGLLTGSYGSNKSGGVLRKNIGDLSDEINVTTDGTFKAAPENGGIISTLDSLRIYGYSYDDGTYSDNGNGTDNCPFGITSFDDGDCSNWGNPQSEMFLESLRYLAGASPNASFNSSDSRYISTLDSATWSDPISTDNYCASLNVLQFNASSSSYDGDALGGVSDIGSSEAGLAEWVNAIGSVEGIHNTNRFVGATAASNDGLCTPKSISNLSDVSGTCPDAPSLEGTYDIAGLAYYARSNQIRSTPAGTKTVRTFGVSLASATPSVTIPVPGQVLETGETPKAITIIPACENTQELEGVQEGNCAIVDFKVVEQTSTDLAETGKLYINWEAAEQGGDYDSDMWGVLDYKITASTVSITTDVIQQSSDRPLAFGYVISGTETDGFHVHSGINGYTRAATNAPATAVGCSDCQTADEATTNTYIVGSSRALPLEPPLFYAAKWGGYDPDEMTDAATINEWDPTDKTYFFANDPWTLQASLATALGAVEESIGAASSVATNSTRLTSDSFVYQALFNSADWSGNIRSFAINDDGSIAQTYSTSTDDRMQTSSSGRSIFTYSATNGGSLVDFAWTNLSDAQKAYLMDGGTESDGQMRLNWLSGDRSNEGTALRERDSLLGDIVNSSPAYLGDRDFGYSLLPADQGGSTYADHVATKKAEVPSLFVGANDGMLHAFYAEGDNAMRERFAYVPNGVYPKLANLTDLRYGSSDAPHEYTVDGPLAVGDVYIDSEWKSIVVGTFGAGGKGIFALDVTDPDNPSLMFELSAADLNLKGDLGYVTGAPSISRMANGRWAVILGNGVDAGTSQLFVVDLADPLGDYTQVIDTGTGEGISGVAVLPDAFGMVQKVYAGDYSGNLWVFDLTNSSESKWTVGLRGSPLFVARDANGTRQPISGAPTLGFNIKKDVDGSDQRGVVMAYFGTGQYLYYSDNVVPTDGYHDSFYAIADTGVAQTYTTGGTTDGRLEILHEKTINQTSSTSRDINGEDGEKPDWSNNEGWFLDFDVTAGERVITKPLLLFDRLLFSTLVPSSVPCDFGGESWLMELEAVGDRYGENRLLDSIERFDTLVLGNPTYGVVGQGQGKLLINQSSPKQDEEDIKIREEDLVIPTEGLGRQSWRQLK